MSNMAFIYIHRQRSWQKTLVRLQPCGSILGLNFSYLGTLFPIFGRFSRFSSVKTGGFLVEADSHDYWILNWIHEPQTAVLNGEASAHRADFNEFADQTAQYRGGPGKGMTWTMDS